MTAPAMTKADILGILVALPRGGSVPRSGSMAHDPDIEGF